MKRISLIFSSLLLVSCIHMNAANNGAQDNAAWSFSNISTVLKSRKVIIGGVVCTVAAVAAYMAYKAYKQQEEQVDEYEEYIDSAA